MQTSVRQADYETGKGYQDTNAIPILKLCALMASLFC